MTELFVTVLNMSITAGWLVPMVFLLRLVMKRAPKWIRGLLWAMVAVRLVCPFGIKSIFSLLPSTHTIETGILLDRTPAVNSGIPAINDGINGMLEQYFTPAIGDSVNPLQVWLWVLAGVWVTGMAVMVIYTAVSYWRLRYRLRDAVQVEGNVYECGAIDAAFVMGIRNPKIYLPVGMDTENACHVIAHEKAHIHRKDHWWKLLGLVLLTVHWFNPVLWWGYRLFCRDIELACDEYVIRNRSLQERADYSQALLACSRGQGNITPCPLAFGEVGVKSRVESVLNYKQPSTLMADIATVLCVLAVLCFLTDPLTTPTGGRGIGVQSIRLESHERAAASLEIDYLFLGKEGIRSHTISSDGSVHSHGCKVAYDAALGQYAMVIEFADTQPTRGFRNRYPAGEVFELENETKFKGTLKFKVLYPEENGFAIYVGSDRPFDYKEPGVYNSKYIGGTLEFKLYN